MDDDDWNEDYVEPPVNLNDPVVQRRFYYKHQRRFRRHAADKARIRGEWSQIEQMDASEKRRLASCINDIRRGERQIQRRSVALADDFEWLIDAVDADLRDFAKIYKTWNELDTPLDWLMGDLADQSKRWNTLSDLEIAQDHTPEVSIVHAAAESMRYAEMERYFRHYREHILEMYRDDHPRVPPDRLGRARVPQGPGFLPEDDGRNKALEAVRRATKAGELGLPHTVQGEWVPWMLFHNGEATLSEGVLWVCLDDQDRVTDVSIL